MFNRKVINYLKQWKNRKKHKPLILRGARQVGKTSAVEIFAKENFAQLININLENPEHGALFREPLSLQDFNQIIQLKFNQKIEEGKTLLFIDEIQNSVPLMRLLRFFYEEQPNLHVIAAGSLLEVKLHKASFSFPVGRVEYTYLHPLDFFEYLEAKGERILLDILRNIQTGSSVPQAIHDQSIKLFNEYMLIGGMPEAVKTFIETQDILAVNRVYNSLFTSFLDDVYKYAPDSKVKYLIHVIENAPLFAGQTITYEHFANSAYRSREMGEAFDTLEKTMLVNRIVGSKETALPLVPKKKKAPKIIFIDIGMVNYKMGIREQLFNIKDLSSLYQGRIAEQVVGQNLLSLVHDQLVPVSYWYRDIPGSTAEVDYIIAHKGMIMPIEVKSGSSGRLRSLVEFTKRTGMKIAVRVYGGVFREEAIKSGNVSFKLISIPFYLLPRITELVDSLQSKSSP
ncbi:MAG: AAA family ATPase [Candidatus Margulisbacteria bacterium]|nr:AAA family ATPase [Candidatus Margulisiibacteriota bacterium]